MSGGGGTLMTSSTGLCLFTIAITSCLFCTLLYLAIMSDSTSPPSYTASQAACSACAQLIELKIQEEKRAIQRECCGRWVCGDCLEVDDSFLKITGADWGIAESAIRNLLFLLPIIDKITSAVV